MKENKFQMDQKVRRLKKLKGALKSFEKDAKASCKTTGV